MNSDSTPPARNRGDHAESDVSPVAPGQAPAASALPSSSGSGGAGGLPPVSSGPAPDRPDAPRHRVASGLPPQPPPSGLTKSEIRPDHPPTTAGLRARSLAPAADALPAAAQVKGSQHIPTAPGNAAATPDLPVAEGQRSGKMTPASVAPSPSMANPVAPPQTGPARVVLGEPEPPISGRPDGFATSAMEPKRITPRSPRAALEPDQVPMPTRPSRRARNPFVIVGNAIITCLLYTSPSPRD